MIIIRLYGGLGNQLFQFAFGQYLKQSHKHEIVYDLSYYKQFQKPAPSILNFELDLKQAEDAIVKKFIRFKSFRLNSLFHKLRFNSRYKKKIQSTDILSAQEVFFFDNYWQKFAFIEALVQTNRIMLKPICLNPKLDQMSVRLQSIENSVAVHIRRTDYLLPKNKKIFKVLTSDYYEKAQQRLIRQLNHKTPKFIVFSDDIHWVKSNLKFHGEPLFIEKFKDFEDLYLMSQCHHQITANSTFSWWGAYLNQNPEKIVITPSVWYNNNSDSDDLIPSSWIKI